MRNKSGTRAYRHWVSIGYRLQRRRFTLILPSALRRGGLGWRGKSHSAAELLGMVDVVLAGYEQPQPQPIRNLEFLEDGSQVGLDSSLANVE